MHRAADATPQYHYTLGRMHKARNEPVAAEGAYREALRLNPRFLNAWVSLGILLRGMGRPDEAEVAQREALRIDPDNYLAHLNLGNALLEQRRLMEAVSSFKRALEQKPRSPEAHNNLARTLLDLNDPAALTHYETALRLKPDYFSAAEGLGKTLLRLGDYEAAARAFTHATQLQPDAIDARLQLGHALLSAGRLEDAARELEQLLDAHPRLPKAKAGLASVLTVRGEYERPKALFQQAIADSGGDPALRLCYAVFLLICGEYSEAWNHYEARHLCAGAAQRALPAPIWRGEPLHERRLLVTCEQGMGDELNFASVFPDVIAAAGQCTIECDVRLEKLFRRSFPRATVFGVERKNDETWYRTLERNLDRIPPFDYWIPAGSLPLHFRTSADAFPGSGAYLIASDERVAHWRTQLARLGPGLKVGISWRGGVALTNAAARSLDLNQLEPLLETPNVHFVSLQYGDRRSELESFAKASGHRIRVWQEAIDDYDETAALVASLDLVISVCTAVVHLAGALDRPVWIMAPVGPGWRYGREGPTTIWYPSARIFRQKAAREWGGVIDDVRRDLHRLAKATSPRVVAQSGVG